MDSHPSTKPSAFSILPCLPPFYAGRTDAKTCGSPAEGDLISIDRSRGF